MLERKHTRRDLFQYRSCKLKQNMESFSHALLNTYISCSTKHGERTWQSLTYHIKTCSNIRKLFHSKSKPSESEKNDTEEEERINQEETDEGKETEKITNFPENLVVRSHIRWVPETFHARFPGSVRSYKTCRRLTPGESSSSHERKNLWYPG